MIKIIEDKCTRCGKCIDVCHESCMYLSQSKIHINYEFCSTCTQCIAVCPNLALQWGNFQPLPFDNSMLPTSAQLDELFKQRRTIRYFTNDKPERELLEEIINYGVYAPTHNHKFRAIALDDEFLLNYIDKVVFSYNKKIYRYLYKPKIIQTFIKLFAPLQEQEYLRAKPKLESSLKIGRAYFCIPPVIVLIIGDKYQPLSKESAQYILYNIDLYARSKELGSRILVGNQMFLNKSKRLRRMLKIQKKEKIFGTIGLGYPSKKFQNKVIGRKLVIQWNN